MYFLINKNLFKIHILCIFKYIKIYFKNHLLIEQTLLKRLVSHSFYLCYRRLATEGIKMALYQILKKYNKSIKPYHSNIFIINKILKVFEQQFLSELPTISSLKSHRIKFYASGIFILENVKVISSIYYITLFFIFFVTNSNLNLIHSLHYASS